MTETETFEINLQQLRERGVKSRFLSRKSYQSIRVQNFLKRQSYTIVCANCGAHKELEGYAFRKRIRTGLNIFYCSRQCRRPRQGNLKKTEQAMRIPNMQERLAFVADYLLKNKIVK